MIKLEDSFKLIIVAYLVMLITIILDIPLLRQIITFIYISFIPGFLISNILRINLKNRINTYLFSFSLSIAFLMFVGLLMNELYSLLGILRPLSIIPIMITLSTMTLILLFINYKQELLNINKINSFKFKNIFYRILILLLVPILSIIGNIYNNNYMLIIMIIMIVGLYMISVFSTKIISQDLYIFTILAISIALLFHTSLISKYLLGYDLHVEKYVFHLTKINAYWNNNIPSYKNVRAIVNYNSMLSITILPTIYSVLLNIDDDLIFKIIYPLIFSLIPLTLYQIYNKNLNKLVALISVFYFMSNTSAFFGIEPLSIARQIVGEMFFVISILVLLDKELLPRKRQALFLTYGVALIVSHYTLAYIYLFYIVCIFLLSYKRERNKKINGVTVLLLIIMTFSWNLYASASPTRSLVSFFTNMYQNFYNDFIKPEARIPYAAHLIKSNLTFVTLLHLFLYLITNFFIVIGIIELILKPKKIKIDIEYRLMSLLSMFILLSCIIVPNFAPALNFTRFRSITMLILSPFFVLGGLTFFSFIGKIRTFFHRKTQENYYQNNWGLRLVSVVLIAFFLLQIGFVNHIMNDKPISYSLDLNRMKTTNNFVVKINLYDAYTPEPDIFSAIWMSKNVNDTSRIHADLNSIQHVLTSYGIILGSRVSLLSNRTTLWPGDYIYLRHLNVVEGFATTWGGSFKISEISFLRNKNNKIYSNGHSEIYCTP